LGQKDGAYSSGHRLAIQGDSAVGAMIYDFNADGINDLLVLNHLKHGDHRAESFLYWGGSSGLDPRNPSRIPSLGVHGFVAMDPGNIYTRKLEHEYISRAFDAGEPVRFLRLTAKAETPGRSAIDFFVRVAGRAKIWQKRIGKVPQQPKDRPDGYSIVLFETPNLADAPSLLAVEMQYDPVAGSDARVREGGLTTWILTERLHDAISCTIR